MCSSNKLKKIKKIKQSELFVLTLLKFISLKGDYELEIRGRLRAAAVNRLDRDNKGGKNL